MGVLSRFKDIMESNVNALLDKAEDPEKMVDQCLRNLNSDLGKVKSETAAVMAEEQRAKRELDECTAEINKYQSYAEKAVAAGNDDDARKFLEKKSQLAGTQSSLQQTYDAAAKNAQNMRAMHDKLCGDIAELEARRDAIKGKMKVARTQERINKMNSSVSSANDSIGAFERMEAKANAAVDKANAMAELNAGPQDSIKDLMGKYDAPANNSSIEDELAALKASMGK